MDVHKMLEQVKAGQLDIAEAEAKLKDLPYEDLGYAKLDHHRKLRSGFGETIFCQGKPDPYLKEIFLKFYERDGEVLGTRASQAQYELIRSLVPAAVYDPISRIVKVEKPDKELVGCVAVCTGGTADIPVAEEAAQTAEYFGTKVDRIYDVGVAGIHRLFKPERAYLQGKLHYCGSRNGRGSWNGDRRSGRRTGDRSTYICRIWSQFPWSVGSSDHDQFLCKWNFGSKY